MNFTSRLIKLFATLLITIQITGCANSPNDPLEGYNRQVFYFNEALDTVVIKPAAHTYHDLVPDVIQTMVSNFFGNIADVWIAFNNFLQGRGDEGFSDVSRIIINTFAGIGGLIDVASDAGLPKHNQDLGQTFGVWGAPPGPYFVIPVLGPSTIRDTIAAPADYWYGDPITYISNDSVAWGAVILRGISTRAKLIDASSVIDDAAIDRYEFIRDAFLQRRHHLIHDRERREEQWETVDTDNTSQKEKDRQTDTQIWLPSGEIKPPSSPVEKTAETTTSVAMETTTPEPAAKTAFATETEYITGSILEKNELEPALKPAPAETIALIH
ncbi:MAG: VacJ family lipoprotein [Betaproteobacteria bacterium]|nr:VacJ family lipoprotein [Betaproteobacteria bacterium]